MYEYCNMKNIILILKNLFNTIKVRTSFFLLLCIGQIISICVVIAAVGVFELWEIHRPNVFPNGIGKGFVLLQLVCIHACGAYQ